MSEYTVNGVTNDFGAIIYPWDDEIMADCRRRKAQLIEMYGGIEGLHKHMDEERPRLEKDGWNFVDADEFRERNRRRHIAEVEG
jgi:hypothetical protein